MKFMIRAIVFAGLWALMTEARADSWIIGGPVVVVSAVTAVLLTPGRGQRWSGMGCLRFGPYFVYSSLLGAFDVAWRSVHPQMPIDPQMMEYDLRLPDRTTARVCFLNIVNLLPGTVAADVRDDVLQVHVIDGRQPMEHRLATLERIVASLFATGLETRDASERVKP